MKKILLFMLSAIVCGMANAQESVDKYLNIELNDGTIIKYNTKNIKQLTWTDATETAYDCWIGHGMSVEEITENDSFKIGGNTSMTSLRGNHVVEYAPEDAGDRIYVVVPKSFNINKEQIIFGVYPNEGVFPMDSDFEEDIVINNITYSVVSSTRLDSDKYMITFKQ